MACGLRPTKPLPEALKQNWLISNLDHTVEIELYIYIYTHIYIYPSSKCIWKYRFKISAISSGLNPYSVEQITLMICTFTIDLSFVQEITIVNSIISTLDEDAFCGVEHIHRLYIVNCGITLAPNVTPLQLSLKDLILNDNRIRSFPANYFDGLSLKHLQVNNNLLTSVPHIRGLAPSLVVLSLSRNLISTIDGLFINTTFHQLRSIHLERNIISFVEAKISAPQLIGLHLRKNNISCMDDPEAPGVDVDLRDNPLHCNAALAWAVKAGESFPETRCASPSCAAGHVLSDLGRVIH